MKKIGILLLLLGINGCGESDPSKSKECIQAKNRVTIYTNSLNDLKDLYSDDLNSSEAKRRISAMQARIDSAKTAVNSQCSRK